MTLRQALGEPLWRKPAAVVFHDEPKVAVRREETDIHAPRICVLDDVGKQLACSREDELLARMAVSIGELEIHVDAGAVRGLLRNRSERGFEARLLEDVRVQLEDRLAQLSNRDDERVVCPTESRVLLHLSRLLELVARGQEILDRIVVKRIGQRFPFALLRLERIGEQS